MKIDNRGWDELRAAGGELSNHCGIERTIAVVSRIAPQFEVPRSQEAEAVDVFLSGLLRALGDVASEIEDDGDDELPNAAQCTSPSPATRWLRVWRGL
jgi:hypothetical protein